uniref:Uncharacterized protein n=1 Tax=Curvibacter symbiont subsp. Hydra magnipapillata TaxID=667019 RepID=C9YAI8_CURXX|nr:hypothetical protein Csp_A11390 [Curvibacter putative symbiont of Hydra magnipapillata]
MLIPRLSNFKFFEFKFEEQSFRIAPGKNIKYGKLINYF